MIWKSFTLHVSNTFKPSSWPCYVPQYLHVKHPVQYDRPLAIRHTSWLLGGKAAYAHVTLPFSLQLITLSASSCTEESSAKVGLWPKMHGSNVADKNENVQNDKDWVWQTYFDYLWFGPFVHTKAGKVGLGCHLVQSIQQFPGFQCLGIQRKRTRNDFCVAYECSPTQTLHLNVAMWYITFKVQDGLIERGVVNSSVTSIHLWSMAWPSVAPSILRCGLQVFSTSMYQAQQSVTSCCI